MAKARITFWFVHPLDSSTNRVLAEYLNRDNAREGVLCEDKMKRDMWECSHEQLARLENSANTLHIRFRMFVQRGRYGKVRQWLFSRKTKARPVRSRATVAP